MSIIKQNPLYNTLLVGASLVLIVAGLRASAPIVSPFLLAFFLATLLYPAYQRLLQRGIPTWLAVSLMILGVTLIGSGLIALLWVSIEQLRSNLWFYTNRLLAQRRSLEDLLSLIGVDAPTLISQEVLNRQLLISTAASLLTNLGSLLFTSVFVLITTIFLLLQTHHLRERLAQEWGPNSFISAQIVEVAQRIARFFAIRVRVNLIVAIGITLWLLILGVDLALLWGILAFFLGFVMYVGLFIAAVPPVLLALAESGLLWALLAGVGILVINMSVENVVAPAMMAQGLNLAPVVVLMSLVFWSWVLGPLGLILAIPLTVIVVMVLAGNAETRWLIVLLTMDTTSAVELAPPPAPPPTPDLKPLDGNP